MWQAILASMLALQSPGKSIYSQTIVPEGAPAACADQYSLLCLPPRYSEAHQAYTRAETWGEGVRRYAIIANAAEDVVFHVKRSSPRAHLWRYLLAMLYGESGYRKDVHLGVGKASRGDCDWRGPPGKRERVPGSCKSHCLAQIMLGPRRANVKTVEGWTADDLVGIDYESTKRCLTVATRALDGAIMWCTRWGPKPVASCVVGRYAGGMVASTDRRILARVRIVNKLWHTPTKLEREVLLELGMQPEGEQEAAAGERVLAVR